MRRLGLMVAMLTCVGCGVLRDAFPARGGVAGTAAGQTLTVERLATLAGKGRGIPLRADVLAGIARVYLDYAVFATALALGRDLHDSALVLAAQWPEVAQLEWQHVQERLIAARGTLTAMQVDSAYGAGTVRLFQHILVRIPPNPSPALAKEKKTEADGVLRQAAARHGANFAELARRFSDDPGSKLRGGYLPAARRGRFVPAFDSAAWALPPGAMSGVVRSPYGFHIIRRPSLGEVRDSFRVALEDLRLARFDSLYLDSLTTATGLHVESGAPALVRRVVPRIAAARDDERTLASYRGGVFRVKDLARWLLALGPNDIRELTTASDTQVERLVTVLAQRELVRQQAKVAGVRLTPEDWRRVRAHHDSIVVRLEALLALSPQLLHDSTATERARVKLAMRHVNDYLDGAIMLSTAPFVPVPPAFASALPEGRSWSLDEAGMGRALERAQALRAAAEAAAAAVPPGALKPAPGPAPVPGDSGKRAPQ